ncbi:hypothetical protein SAMN05660733_00765 [Lentzea albidocapillata]|uniref:Uncharacterized protein n=1 Tax=Lentzea albidocapillata TaxID=40571 RepID=A0A1W2AWT5_9PSEU|nr:hypothetical protein SAMN05660733_00765 [Lentzea albidocapillata]
MGPHRQRNPLSNRQPPKATGVPSTRSWRGPPDQIAGGLGAAPPGEARNASSPPASQPPTRLAPQRSLLGKLIQNRLQIRSQHRNQKRSRHLMILIHNKRRRNAISRNTPKNVDKTPGRSIINRRIGQTPVLHKIPRMILGSLLDVNPDNLSPSVKNLLHLRSLSPAGPTPGPPNIDHNRLTRVIRKPNDLPILKQRLALKPFQLFTLTNRIPNLDLPPRSNEIKIPSPNLRSIFPGSTPGKQQQKNQKPLHAPVTRGSVAPTGSE